MNNDISQLLRSLAAEKLQSSTDALNAMSEDQLTVLFIEATRALDYWMVQGTFAPEGIIKLPEPELNILTRGWNPFVQIVLPRIGTMRGVPLLESTDQTIRAASAELQKLGVSVLVAKTAELLERNFLSARHSSDKIIIRMKNSGKGDLFLDQLEDDRLEDIENSFEMNNNFHFPLSPLSPVELQNELNGAVFRWETSKGTMAGYHSTPALDEHYAGATLPILTRLRDKAGFHPDARISGVRAADLSVIISLLTSSRLKHIQLVASAKRLWPEVNFWMSLSIWKPKDEVVEILSEATGMEEHLVSTIIDILTLTADSEADLTSDVDPVIPFFIKFTDAYLIEPASALFINPFDTAKRLQNQPQTHTSLRSPRESWMRTDLNALFQGSRYYRLETPAKLKLNSKTLTDVDGAIFDRTTGELCLFQFKWQEFTGATTRQLHSRAKNFVAEVQKWEKAVLKYVSELGLETLLRTLRFSGIPNKNSIRIRLIAVGRDAARFSDIGYPGLSDSVAVCTWSQFIRLRYEIGPDSNVLSELHRRIKEEQTWLVELVPIPYEISIGEQKILFENLWNEKSES